MIPPFSTAPQPFTQVTVADAVLPAVVAPRLDRVGSDAHKFDAKRLEGLALLQVDHLQDAAASAGPHAE
jgi:hypothetical protein